MCTRPTSTTGKRTRDCGEMAGGTGMASRPWITVGEWEGMERRSLNDDGGKGYRHVKDDGGNRRGLSYDARGR